jgi:hypothetical protein
MKYIIMRKREDVLYKEPFDAMLGIKRNKVGSNNVWYSRSGGRWGVFVFFCAGWLRVYYIYTCKEDVKNDYYGGIKRDYGGVGKKPAGDAEVSEGVEAGPSGNAEVSAGDAGVSEAAQG